MEHRVEQIRKNLNQVRNQIEAAARRARRNPDEVQVVVVTKSQPIEVVRDTLLAGAKILGENYPEEALPKVQAVRDDFAVEWHMIGHLQSRKIPIVVEWFQMLESLDRVDLALKLEKRLAEAGKVLPVLLEFNVGGEVSKSGWDVSREELWEGILPEVEKILALPHLRVRGVMTMPPLMEHPEQSRPYFTRLIKLRDFLAKRFHETDFSIISMGTSLDYPIAVEEGATLIRVGTAILGPRPVKKLLS